MAKRKKTHYAVRRGRIPGIYSTWAECQAQVNGFSNARFQGFNNQEDAEDFLAQGDGGGAAAAATSAGDCTAPRSFKRAKLSGAVSVPSFSDLAGDAVRDASTRNASCSYSSSFSTSSPCSHPTNSPPAPLLDYHYSSVALKLMEKMGHKHGEGLGKRRRGISSPISIKGSRPAVRGGGAGIGHADRKKDNGADVVVTPTQQRAIDAAANKENVFITGPAGTGKSVVLKRILERLKTSKRRFAAVAPTGTTALSCGGQTLYSFAGCGVPVEANDFQKCWEITHRKNWRNIEVLVVEEVSMFSGEFLDRLSDVVSAIRGDDRPFGGIQLIFCGDFLQLPPIQMSLEDVQLARDALAREDRLHKKGRRSLKRQAWNDNGVTELHQNRGFAFQSKVWQGGKIRVITLQKVFRQSNTSFISVLHELRRGNVTSTVADFLKQCERPLPPNDSGIVPTRLYATNKDVRRENNSLLKRLPGREYEFYATDFVEPETSDGCLTDYAINRLRNNSFFRACIAEKNLKLKEGAQVMLLKNETQVKGKDRLVNGSRGRVIGFTKDKEYSSESGELLNEDSDISAPVYPVVSFLNGRTVAIEPERFDSRIVGLGACVRVATPLKLAWAITMHKCQGLTLDCVQTNLSGVFTEAQAYVALSRATNEHALELRGFSFGTVRADWRALAFYKHPSRHFPHWNEPWKEMEEEEGCDNGEIPPAS